MALWKVHDYHDAEAVFQLYLELYPDGEDAGDARDYLQKIRVELSPANPARKDAIDQARSDLNQLQQLRLDHPNDPEVYYALANLYYEIGDYSEAARYYYQAQSIDAVYREKALIQERLVIGEDGQPHALTPGEVERLDREENPLVIYGTHTYRARAGDSVISGGQRYFNVSGYIRNQSSRWLRDVQIEVRFLNAVNSIQDVKTVRIGTMPPGAIRVFRAEATSFDNLYNIADFQAIPRVER
jgi:tetratricopeptide (TPR) repeat protein